MSRAYKLLGNGQLYRAEHKELGTWWFSNGWSLIDFCDIAYSTFYMKLKGHIRTARGWEFSIVDERDCADKSRLDPK